MAREKEGDRGQGPRDHLSGLETRSAGHARADLVDSVVDSVDRVDSGDSVDRVDSVDSASAGRGGRGRFK